MKGENSKSLRGGRTHFIRTRRWIQTGVAYTQPLRAPRSGCRASHNTVSKHLPIEKHPQFQYETPAADAGRIHYSRTLMYRRSLCTLTRRERCLHRVQKVLVRRRNGNEGGHVFVRVYFPLTKIASPNGRCMLFWTSILQWDRQERPRVPPAHWRACPSPFSYLADRVKMQWKDCSKINRSVDASVVLLRCEN